MTRRSLSALLAALLALAPFPAWAQVGRVALKASLAPAPFLGAGAAAAAAFAPSMTAALTPSPLALGPLLAVPSVQPSPLPAPTSAARPIQVLTRAAERAVAAPEEIGRLFDSAPDAPDLERLATVKTPASPEPWRPSSVLLKPAASAVNAWRSSRHQKRMNARMPWERVTSEEIGVQDTLATAHAAISGGRLQDALEALTKLFKARGVNGWFRANAAFRPYQDQGHEYLRFVERAVKLAYERAHARGLDEALVAEARASIPLGHAYRETAIQDRDSSHCAHHALFNAIQASTGFAVPVAVGRFVERARELMNTNAETLTGKAGADLTSLENQLGIKFGVDVGMGMGAGSIADWARRLGMSFEASRPPKDDAGWSALLASGHAVLLDVRLFHERYKHSPAQRSLHGHDYEMLHHEVYLLGAFESVSLGKRLYMVQDSGSGATDFYTAEELSAIVFSVELVSAAAPVVLP